MSIGTTAEEAQSPEGTSPNSNGSGSLDDTVDSVPQTKDSKQQDDATAICPPPPKTDKPRPHVCQNCGRAFARLEHLKRHERSHTKEKPFECPECTRCFARRDLLLRHQQKLHFAQNTARPRGGRRESVSAASTTSNRVRKNSVANSTAPGPAVGFGGHRPRANTIGHLDLSSLGLFDGRANIMDPNGHHHRMSMSGMPSAPGLEYRGMSNSMGNHGPIHQLPKLDTRHLNGAIEDSLHTAPPYAGMDPFSVDSIFHTPGSANTVNPAQLHFGNSDASPLSPFDGAHHMHEHNPMDSITAEDDFTWMRNWSLAQMQLASNNDFAVDESSPSGIGSEPTSMIHPAEISIDPSIMDINANWMPNDMSIPPLMTPVAFQLDALNQGLPNLDQQHIVTMSPHIMQESPTTDGFFNPACAQINSPGTILQNQHLGPTSVSNFGSDSPSMASSMTGSARQSSVTSVSTNSITDATRQALLISLSQPSVFGHGYRKYSQPSISSPLSPGGALRSGVNLPSTTDLQRYVNAYIQFFHPHLPFLHIPTLSFDSADYINNLRTAGAQVSYGQSGIIGGGGCLILSMAAIGALYEYDHTASRELFDSAKRMIQLYLEERRKADMSAAVNGSYASGANGSSSHNTPLWLVQAMLLNVIYGHHCGDKQSAEIASTHCAALVSLARAAELAQPPSAHTSQNVAASDEGASPSNGSPAQASQSAGYRAWIKWKDAEERKRTLYAVFILSSLLVIAYNHAPAITNSEVLLDLPCDEELWAAESAGDWIARGGSQAADQNALPFSTALSTLLTANQRNPGAFTNNWYHQLQSGNFTRFGSRQLDIKPSTFGCLVLINALHNFIWETRNRHHSRQWTAKETESMFAHIEPALNAWQAAWKANERHHIQRPNPFGSGPLSADSIPLLDLAFVRLFVNLGRSKEAFWQRDFDAMANEFARGAEIAQHAEGSPGADHMPDRHGSAEAQARQGLRRPSQVLTTGQGSKRERYLRRAAFYAADSLSISAKFSLTYSDASSHELPIQSAMCFFDCSQVLAEWASAVQERVGRYLGVLGREDIDFTQVPAIMLLEAEDIDLLTKLDNICQMMEEKLVRQSNGGASDFSSIDPHTGMHITPHHIEQIPTLRELGFGAKILKATALMLERGAVWPVTHVMASALDVQASHMNQRAEASLTAFS